MKRRACEDSSRGCYLEYYTRCQRQLFAGPRTNSSSTSSKRGDRRRWAAVESRPWLRPRKYLASFLQLAPPRPRPQHRLRHPWKPQWSPANCQRWAVLACTDPYNTTRYISSQLRSLCRCGESSAGLCIWNVVAVVDEGEDEEVVKQNYCDLMMVICWFPRE